MRWYDLCLSLTRPWYTQAIPISPNYLYYPIWPEHELTVESSVFKSIAASLGIRLFSVHISLTVETVLLFKGTRSKSAVSLNNVRCNTAFRILVRCWRCSTLWKKKNVSRKLISPNCVTLQSKFFKIFYLRENPMRAICSSKKETLANHTWGRHKKQTKRDTSHHIIICDMFRFMSTFCTSPNEMSVAF